MCNIDYSMRLSRSALLVIPSLEPQPSPPSMAGVRRYRASPCGGEDGQKFVRLERGATDQAAVDIGHCKQFGRIAGLHAPAVENTRGSGNSSIPGRDPRTDERMDVLRLLGRGIAPCADRPHRLIS